MTAYRTDDATKPIPCAGCGTFIDPKSAQFSLQGDLSCRACASRGAIDAAQVRGREGLSINRGWVRVALILALVAVRLLLRFSFR